MFESEPSSTANTEVTMYPESNSRILRAPLPAPGRSSPPTSAFPFIFTLAVVAVVFAFVAFQVVRSLSSLG